MRPRREHNGDNITAGRQSGHVLTLVCDCSRRSRAGTSSREGQPAIFPFFCFCFLPFFTLLFLLIFSLIYSVCCFPGVFFLLFLPFIFLSPFLVFFLILLFLLSFIPIYSCFAVCRLSSNGCIFISQVSSTYLGIGRTKHLLLARSSWNNSKP